MMVEMQKKTISEQAQEIASLHEYVLTVDGEKKKMVVEKASTDASFSELQDTFTKNMVGLDVTILSFYVNSVLHLGSLSYLDPLVPRTLDVV